MKWKSRQSIQLSLNNSYSLLLVMFTSWCYSLELPKDTEDPHHVVTLFIVVYLSQVFHYWLVQVDVFALHVTLTYLYYIEHANYIYVKKRTFFYLLGSFVWHLHMYLSQNLDADGHFRVLNVSKSQLEQMLQHKTHFFPFFFNFGRKNLKNLCLINGYFLTIFLPTTWRFFTKLKFRIIGERCCTGLHIP